MAATAEALDLDTIQATINYHLDTGVMPWTFTGGPGSTERRSTGQQDPHVMTIHNGRPHIAEFALETHGFHFIRHDTKMKDFYDEAEIKRIYYPEMEELVKKESGAKRVIVFDHTVRLADESVREAKKLREPVLRAHNDYTEWSAPQRVRDLVPDEAEELLKRRFAIIQVWRPINKPVETDPLGICDARTIDFEDGVVSERRYPGRVGQTYAMKYNPKHKWYWFPRMRRDEALVFKVFESLKDGRARWTAHSAFKDPTSPPNAAPRESIEIRTIAFF
jgi:hypothetical protein